MLRRAFRDANALQADAQPRRVHHDEHGREAAVFLADQITRRAAVLAEFHHARRARHNAELMLDPGADDVVAFAERSVVIDEKLRYEEQRDAARSGRRVGAAREHEVDDILRHVVLAVGDENFCTRDAVRSIILRHGARRERPQIRARVRLGQVHGAGPFARHHVRQIFGFDRVGAARLDGVDRALRQQRTEPERDVRCVPYLSHCRRDDLRQALPAELLGAGQRTPAAFRELPVRIAKTGRRRHGASGKFRSRLVAWRIERC